MVARGRYILSVDRMTQGAALTGWAIDAADPTRRRLLVLRRDGAIVARQWAALYRAELVVDGRDGFHGFGLPLPDSGDIALEDAALGLHFAVHRQG